MCDVKLTTFFEMENTELPITSKVYSRCDREKKNDLEQIEKLLLGHGETRDDDEIKRVLIDSCYLGKEDALELILKHRGITVDFCDEKSGRTPLICACTTGNMNIVKLLLQHGVDRININAIEKNSGKSALIYSCEKGHELIVYMLLQHGADVNIADINNKTAFIWSCQEGHENIVELLTRHKVDTNIEDTREKSELMLNACRKGWVRIVEVLIKHSNADKNDVDEFGMTCLMHSAEKGFVRIVELLLKHGANADSSFLFRDKKKMNIVTTTTALILASENGFANVVNLILKYGANINARNAYKSTALIQACRNGHCNVVGVLLEHGANVNAWDQYEKSALMYACQAGFKSVIKLLLKNGRVNLEARDKLGRTALVLACLFGMRCAAELLLKNGACLGSGVSFKCLISAVDKCDFNMVKLLVDHGADLNTADGADKTVLMHACHEGNQESVELLLNHGADIAYKDGYGYTGLMYSCEAQNENVVEFLLQKSGVSVDSANSQGKTALMISCEKGFESIVKLLLKQGLANTSCVDICKKTALMLSIENGHERIVKLLLLELDTDSVSRDLNKKDRDKRTALMLSCIKGKRNIVEMLLQHGAGVDINAKSDQAKTALIYSIENAADSDIAELLLNNGSDVEAKDVRMNTPIISACKKGLTTIIKLLLERGVNVNAQDNKGRTAMMWSAFRDDQQALKLFLSAEDLDIDMDLTNIHGHTVFALAFRGKGYCTKMLLTDGRVLQDGKLKQVHKDGVRKITGSLDSLLVMIDRGVFEWDFNMGPFSIYSVSIAALKSRMCPGKIKYKDMEVSPLIWSLIQNDSITTYHFLRQLYFFPEDYVLLSTDSTIRKQIASKLLDEIARNPMSLMTWSFITVSKCISLAGSPNDRAQRVDVLPLPQTIKSRLKFEI